MGDDWEVVRHKRRSKKDSNHTQKQYTHLQTIPSGAFSALAPPDEPRQKTEEERSREIRKKKAARERKKRTNQVQNCKSKKELHHCSVCAARLRCMHSVQRSPDLDSPQPVQDLSAAILLSTFHLPSTQGCSRTIASL